MVPPAQSPWRLWVDLQSVRLLVWVSAAGKDAEPRPEVHLFLADRYSRLSCLYSERAPARADRLQEKAEAHYEAAGIRPLPPAVAAAMPVPRRPIFTNAIGKRMPPGDDAA
jgi:hypothetical protein